RGIARFEEEPLDNDPAHREWTAEEDWDQVQADAAFIAHARLEARVAELEALLAAEKARGDLLRDQRDGAREAVELEQAS
ncbi:hypothetical protein KBZ21_42290, partial [Streptomyces sp. A73]|nr:hypothetical protein [Streptomyces sp. A73]